MIKYEITADTVSLYLFFLYATKVVVKRVVSINNKNIAKPIASLFANDLITKFIGNTIILIETLIGAPRK